jgi:hypothetical protein
MQSRSGYQTLRPSLRERWILAGVLVEVEAGEQQLLLAHPMQSRSGYQTPRPSLRERRILAGVLVEVEAGEQQLLLAHPMQSRSGCQTPRPSLRERRMWVAALVEREGETPPHWTLLPKRLEWDHELLMQDQLLMAARMQDRLLMARQVCPTASPWASPWDREYYQGCHPMLDRELGIPRLSVPGHHQRRDREPSVEHTHK